MRKQALSTLALGAIVASVCSVAPPTAVDAPVRAASIETMSAPTFPEAAQPTAPPTTSADPATNGTLLSRAAPVELLPVPATVPVYEPRIVITETAAPEAAVTVPGVAASTETALITTFARTADGTDHELTVLVVDPEEFRSFTPESTANAPAVWERLRDGDLMITHSAGTLVGAVLGEPIMLTGPANIEPVRVGAFASTGVPPLADVVVSWERGRQLGAQAPNTSIVAVLDDADERAVGEALSIATLGTSSVRERPTEQQATASLGTVQLEPFTYIDNGDGMISIDPGWVKRNITTVEIPGWGAMRCNSIIMPQLVAAFEEIRAAGLMGELNDYGGCYVPRHILFNPARELSRHAWGLAFDTNVATNGYGAIPTIDMRIVEIFQRWGFKWGGEFSTPDGMHFELERVVRPG